MSLVKSAAENSIDAEKELEKLCEDLQAYEQEFSNIINEEKDAFGKQLSRQIDQTTERIRESSTHRSHILSRDAN